MKSEHSLPWSKDHSASSEGDGITPGPKHALFSVFTTAWRESRRSAPRMSGTWSSCCNASWSTRERCPIRHPRPHRTPPPVPVCLSHQAALMMSQTPMVPIPSWTKGRTWKTRSLLPTTVTVGIIYSLENGRWTVLKIKWGFLRTLRQKHQEKRLNSTPKK